MLALPLGVAPFAVLFITLDSISVVKLVAASVWLLSDVQSKSFGVLNSLDIHTNAPMNEPAFGLCEFALLATSSSAPPAFVLTAMGYLSPLSPSQTLKASPISFRLLTQLIRCALRLAAASAGSNMAARMAMMAITTSSSMSVNALFCLRMVFI